MKTTPVMFLLSALLGTMVTMVTCDGHEDTPAPNFDSVKMEGTWYIVATATNQWAPVEPVNLTTVTWPAQVTMGSETTLTLTLSVPLMANDPTSCRSQSLDLVAEEPAGLFDYKNEDYEVVVLEVDYVKGFAFVHTAVHGDDDNADCINELYSRTTTVTTEIMTAFKTHSLDDDDIPAENVHTLPNKGTC